MNLHRAYFFYEPLSRESSAFSLIFDSKCFEQSEHVGRRGIFYKVVGSRLRTYEIWLPAALCWDFGLNHGIERADIAWSGTGAGSWANKSSCRLCSSWTWRELWGSRRDIGWRGRSARSSALFWSWRYYSTGFSDIASSSSWFRWKIH